jgi:hypothetical protein
VEDRVPIFTKTFNMSSEYSLPGSEGGDIANPLSVFSQNLELNVFGTTEFIRCKHRQGKSVETPRS